MEVKPLKAEVKKQEFEVADSVLNSNADIREMKVGPAFFDELMEARDRIFEKKVTDFIVK